MITEKAENTPTNELSSFLKKAAYHWPLYVIVILLSLIGAYIYLRYTTPLYLSSGKIYIKDERKGSRELDALKELTLFSSSKTVENEMEIIKSPLLIQDVIRKNGFNIRYFVKGRVINKEMYKHLPIEITILTDSTTVGNYFFDINVLPNQKLQITYIDKYNKNNDKQKKSMYVLYDQPFTVGKDFFNIKHLSVNDAISNNGYQIRIDSITPLAYAKANEVKTSLINKQSSVFEISYEDEVPERAADFLNTLLNAYNESTLKDKNQMAIKTINFIETRLGSLGTELNTLERDVENFKKTRGITEIGENSKLYLEQVKDADQKLNEANIQLSVYDQVDSYINNPSSTNPFTPVLGNIDQTLASLINRYEELLKEQRRLSLSLQPTNPILQNLDQQIADSKTTIQNYISGYRRNAATAKGGLQRKVNQIEGRISQIPGYERQYISLKRQQSVKEALYLYLLQKKEESAVSYASNIVDNKIISPAYIPNRPVSPRKSTLFSAAILAGFVLTSLYLFLKYSLNVKVHTKKEVEKITGLPVVAEIFKQEQKKTDTSLQPRSLLAEQMLNLRNNLKFLLSKVSETPVILFTSSISGEGKTFLSAHLGNSLTLNNKKVILLELDFRKPKLSKTFGIDNASGLTNYLVDNESLNQNIKKVPGTPGLYILPSGPIPPNPVELLESTKMQEVFCTLKKQFDYIIVDTAPLGLVADAKSLIPFVDCALFVVRFNYTPKPKLDEVAENMNGTTFKSMGVVFNSIVPGTSHSVSKYGSYNYGYGYGYGYYNENKKAFSLLFEKLKSRLI